MRISIYKLNNPGKSDEARCYHAIGLSSIYGTISDDNRKGSWVTDIGRDRLTFARKERSETLSR
jgi:hypothetical protein